MGDILKYILWIVLGVAIFALLWYFKSIVFFLIVSVVLSLVARPISDFIKRFHLKNWYATGTIAAFLTVLTLWIIVVSFFWITMPLLINEVQFLSKVDADMIFEKFNKSVGSFFSPVYDSDVLNEGLILMKIQLKTALVELMDFSKVGMVITDLLDFLGGTFVFFFSVSFITFFFLKEEWLVMEGLLLFIPSSYENGLKHMLVSIKTLLRRYFTGVLLQVSLITILVTSGFLLIRLPFEHALVIGLFAGFINVIPYLGPLMGGCFGFVVVSVVQIQIPNSYTLLSLWGGTIIIFLVVQLLDNLVFQPFIFSSSVRAHPLEIFLVILMAGYMSGIVGMFLAIPVYTILRVVAREFFFNYRLVKKLTERL